MKGMIKGILFFHSEMGTEGGFWAFQDEKFIHSDGFWSYKGLYILENGDKLIIYDKNNPEVVVWLGIISLKKHSVFTEAALGMWIHSDQEGISREEWAKFFFEEYPAELIPKSSPA